MRVYPKILSQTPPYCSVLCSRRGVEGCWICSSRLLAALLKHTIIVLRPYRSPYPTTVAIPCSDMFPAIYSLTDPGPKSVPKKMPPKPSLHKPATKADELGRSATLGVLLGSGEIGNVSPPMLTASSVKGEQLLPPRLTTTVNKTRVYNVMHTVGDGAP